MAGMRYFFTNFYILIYLKWTLTQHLKPKGYLTKSSQALHRYTNGGLNACAREQFLTQVSGVDGPNLWTKQIHAQPFNDSTRTKTFAQGFRTKSTSGVNFTSVQKTSRHRSAERANITSKRTRFRRSKRREKTLKILSATE